MLRLVVVVWLWLFREITRKKGSKRNLYGQISVSGNASLSLVENYKRLIKYSIKNNLIIIQIYSGNFNTNDIKSWQTRFDAVLSPHPMREMSFSNKENSLLDIHQFHFEIWKWLFCLLAGMSNYWYKGEMASDSIHLMTLDFLFGSHLKKLLLSSLACIPQPD